MKRFLALTFFLLVVLAQSGCKKRLFDYRNKYVGDYAITSTIHTLADGSMTTGQIIYHGKVYYDKKEHEKGVLVIVYSESQHISVTIDRKGKVISPSASGEFYDRDLFSFSFENAPNGTPSEMKGTRI